VRWRPIGDEAWVRCLHVKKEEWMGGGDWQLWQAWAWSGDTVIVRGGGGPIRGVGEETDRWACLWEWAPTAASGNPLRSRPGREKQKEFKF
jgi:hypothetical protein